MRKNIKSTTAIAIFLLFLITSFHSCRRQDGIIKSDPINQSEAKAWIQKNGLAYKNETISVQVPNNLMLTGKLNWQKAKQFHWEGRDYIDIPFEFAGFGKVIPGDDQSAPAHFNLVLRKKGVTEFEGAVRTTMHLEQQVMLGSVKNFQSYQLLDGQPANTWMVKGAERKLFATQRLDIDPIAAANIELLRASKGKRQLGATGADRLMTEAPIDCPPIALTSYQNICWDDPSRGQYNVTCASVPVTEYVPDPTCSSANNPQPPSAGGGATGGPPNPPNPPPYPPDDDDDDDDDLPVLDDDCAEAMRLAALMKLALADADVNARLQELKNKKHSINEYGFAILKVGDGYEVTALQTDNNKNSVNVVTPGGARVVSIVHMHPPGGSAVHSSTDILGLNSYLHNPDYIGSIVINGDDMHMLSVTNSTQYNNFITVSTAKGFYDKDDPTGWKEGTEIYDEFKDLSTDFMKLHMDGTDATLPTQLYLMESFDLGRVRQPDGSKKNMGTGMGTTFFKYNNYTKTFTKQETKAERKTDPGGGQTMSMGGTNITTQYYKSIEVGNGCELKKVNL